MNSSVNLADYTMSIDQSQTLLSTNTISDLDIGFKQKIKYHGPVIFSDRVEIAGRDLDERLSEIEQRLGLLHQRPDLESRVDTLREIGDQYRDEVKRLEHIQAVWDQFRDRD
jgi:hypothetical protein